MRARPFAVCAMPQSLSTKTPRSCSTALSMTRRSLFRYSEYDFQLFHRTKLHGRYCGLLTGKKSQSRSCIFELASRMADSELHRRHDGEPISHHSVQVTTTAPILANNIMIFPRIYQNLGKPVILLQARGIYHDLAS
jgi:hypothetical protein